MKPVLSIIIPALNEQHTINATLDSLSSLDGFELAEVIVVDGDPYGSTLKAITRNHVSKILSSPGRGIQMNAGASHARGNMFLFVHADTLLPPCALRRIIDLSEDNTLAGGAFDLGIHAPGFAFRIIEKAASVRSRLTRMPYGDQAIFVHRTWFDRMGGFRPIPIMEDVDLMRRIKRSGGKIHLCPEQVLTSARRWQAEGIVTCTLRNWFILLSYLGGINPQKLSKYY